MGAGSKLRGWLHQKHQFRLSLLGHKAAETGAACLVLMVQGQIAQTTLSHFLVATETGLLTVLPLLGVTLTRHAHHFANRWTAAILVAICAFFSDAVIHGSHYPGAYTEAALTSVGAAVLSVIVSYTPIGRRIDRLAESFAHN